LPSSPEARWLLRRFEPFLLLCRIGSRAAEGEHAILDRIVHNAYRLELSGQSLRKTKTNNSDESTQT
jgi:DNA replication protein DnaC